MTEAEASKYQEQIARVGFRDTKATATKTKSNSTLLSQAYRVGMARMSFGRPTIDDEDNDRFDDSQVTVNP